MLQRAKPDWVKIWEAEHKEEAEDDSELSKMEREAKAELEQEAKAELEQEAQAKAKEQA